MGGRNFKTLTNYRLQYFQLYSFGSTTVVVLRIETVVLNNRILEQYYVSSVTFCTRKTSADQSEGVLWYVPV